MPPAATQFNRKQLAESSCALLVLLGVATSAAAPELGDSSSYLAIHAPTVALRHVEIIDGTGAAPRTTASNNNHTGNTTTISSHTKQNTKPHDSLLSKTQQ